MLTFIYAHAMVCAQDDAAAQAPAVAVAQEAPAAPASLVNEVKVLRERVDQLEKTIAVQAELIAQQKLVLEKIGETVPAVKEALIPPEPKTLVKAFVLDGVNFFQPKDFESVLKKYRNKELGMSDLKRIGDEISGFYRSKGYVNSMAYLPTQEITDNTVEFKVVEGRVGDIAVEKPTHSKSSTVEKRFLVEKGQIMNSKNMAGSLERINKNQDRIVRAVLTPGKTSGTSDILLKNEKERSPYHFYTDFNNRGTNATSERRWGLGFVDTNLLGWDDALSLKFTASPTTSDVFSFSTDYNLPVNRFDTRLGVYAAFARADIGGQFAIISPQGKARALGVYATHPLFKKEFVDEENLSTLTLSSNLTAGFDSIDVLNKVLHKETSHDKISAFKGGINFDEKDDMGRSMLSAEVRAGIPRFLGSMPTHDVKASRAPSDAGGKFQKYNLSLNRTTYLPFNSLLLNTFRFQFTQDPLVSPEQMVIGGADSVRGFPENEYLADHGWIANVELRSPAFLLPSILKVPFDKKRTRLIDAIQFVYFLDAGEGHLNKARVEETRKKYLVGAGFGLRFDLYDHLRGRLDIGFPTGSEQPSDGAAYRVHYGLQYEW
jgi:hemolysin activation/secretion protein